jgi:hypothetical protein
MFTQDDPRHAVLFARWSMLLLLPLARASKVNACHAQVANGRIILEEPFAQDTQTEEDIAHAFTSIFVLTAGAEAV